MSKKPTLTYEDRLEEACEVLSLTDIITIYKNKENLTSEFEKAIKEAIKEAIERYTFEAIYEIDPYVAVEVYPGDDEGEKHPDRWKFNNK